MSKPPNPSDFSDDDTPRAMQVDNPLRKKLGSVGVSLGKLFSQEKVAKAQKMLDTAQEDFHADALECLKLLETAYAKAAQNIAQAAPQMREVAAQAFLLKKKSEALGLALGSEVAESLQTFAGSVTKPADKHLVVVRKHLDVLSLVLKEKLRADAKASKEMLASLASLIKKMR